MQEEKYYYVGIDIDCLTQLLAALSNQYVRIVVLDDQLTAVLSKVHISSPREEFSFFVTNDVLPLVIAELDSCGIKSVFIRKEGFSNFKIILDFNELKEHLGEQVMPANFR